MRDPRLDSVILPNTLERNRQIRYCTRMKTQFLFGHARNSKGNLNIYNHLKSNNKTRPSLATFLQAQERLHQLMRSSNLATSLIHRNNTSSTFFFGIGSLFGRNGLAPISGHAMQPENNISLTLGVRDAPMLAN